MFVKTLSEKIQDKHTAQGSPCYKGYCLKRLIQEKKCLSLFMNWWGGKKLMCCCHQLYNQSHGSWRPIQFHKKTQRFRFSHIFLCCDLDYPTNFQNPPIRAFRDNRILLFSNGVDFHTPHAFSGGFWQISLKQLLYVKNWRKHTTINFQFWVYMGSKYAFLGIFWPKNHQKKAENCQN